MKTHTITMEQLKGSFETLLAASSWESKRLVSRLDIDEGYSVWFEVWKNRELIERTQQIGTAIRRYNAA